MVHRDPSSFFMQPASPIETSLSFDASSTSTMMRSPLYEFHDPFSSVRRFHGFRDDPSSVKTQAFSWEIPQTAPLFL